VGTSLQFHRTLNNYFFANKIFCFIIFIRKQAKEGKGIVSHRKKKKQVRQKLSSVLITFRMKKKSQIKIA
jgi:hypothetical protein